MRPARRSIALMLDRMPRCMQPNISSTAPRETPREAVTYRSWRWLQVFPEQPTARDPAAWLELVGTHDWADLPCQQHAFFQPAVCLEHLATGQPHVRADDQQLTTASIVSCGRDPIGEGGQRDMPEGCEAEPRALGRPCYSCGRGWARGEGEGDAVNTAWHHHLPPDRRDLLPWARQIAGL